MRTTMLAGKLGSYVLVWSAALAVVAGAAAQQPRLNPNVRLEQEAKVLLPESVHPGARPENDIGHMDTAKVIQGMSLNFRRSPQQQADMDQLLQEQQTPGSPNYHKWLTPQQVADRFGMDPKDLQKIAQWLQAQGFTVDPIPASRDHISFSGTVAQVEAAFHTQMHRYNVHGETHFANATDLSLPADLAGVVQTVRHLHDFRPEPRSIIRKPNPRLTSDISGNTFVTPDDFGTIYGVKALYAKGIDGSGRKIAVAGQTQINTTNVDFFRKNAGLPATKLTPTLVPGTGTSTVSNPDLDEAYLDVEWSGGVAKNATIVYAYVGANQNSTVFDALQYAITNNLAPVVSISYGNCEATIGKNEAIVIQGWMQQANVQGQTVIAASGDQGAADCEAGTATVATHGLAVDIPAAIPEVTGIGGTSFSADVTSSGISSTQYWNTSNNSNNGSVRGYIGETVWNDTANPLSSGGGGVSTFFAKPTWQTGVPGIPSDGQRDVPDISLNGSASHDEFIICGQEANNGASWCSANSFRNLNNPSDKAHYQSFDAVGGTSAGTPAFAGILTLIEQATSSPGEGNINHLLYQAAGNAAGYPIAFHDIITGNNKVPCQAASTGCPSGGTLGYDAAPGYDLATGLGSVDAYNLEEAIANSKTLTTTTVQASDPNPATGINDTFTASVAAVNNGGPATSGFVQFMMDGDYVQSNGAPLKVPVANGQAVYQAPFTLGGNHTVAATYFGSAALAGSNSAPLSLVSTGTASPSFAVSASPATVTIPVSGGSQTSILKAQGTGGYAGQVNLSCTVAYTGTGSAKALPTCSAAPISVTLSAANAIVNSTLTVTVAAPTTTLVGGLQTPPSAHIGMEWWTTGSTALFGCVLMFASPQRRKRSGGVLLLAISGSLALVSCGGTSHPAASTTSSGVIAGPYAVTVTATPTSGTAQTTTVAVTVQ